MASKAVEAVRKGELTITPDKYNKIWFNWLENIKWAWGHFVGVVCTICILFVTYRKPMLSNSQTSYVYNHCSRDWCISRQLWWGHQVPFYRCSNGQEEIWLAAHDESDALSRASTKLSGNIQVDRDSDVLDTWFSSGLLPFSSLGWPQQVFKIVICVLWPWFTS